MKKLILSILLLLPIIALGQTYTLNYDSVRYGKPVITSKHAFYGKVYYKNLPLGNIRIGLNGELMRNDTLYALRSSLTGYVPYTGATGDVNLGSHDLTLRTLSANTAINTNGNLTMTNSNLFINNTAAVGTGGMSLQNNNTARGIYFGGAGQSQDDRVIYDLASRRLKFSTGPGDPGKNYLLDGDAVNVSSQNIGDSTAYRYAIWPGSSEVVAVGRGGLTVDTARYSYKLSRRLGMTEVNMGRGGRYLQDQTAADSSIYNIRNNIPVYKPGSLLFIEMTVNDPQGDTTVYTTTNYTSRLTSIATTIQSRGYPANSVKFYNPGYWNSLAQTRHGSIPYRHNIYATAMQGVATTYGYQFIDLYNDMKTKNDATKTLIASDSLHYTVAGHAWIDSALFSRLSPAVTVVDQTPSSLYVYKSLTASGNANVQKDLNVKGNSNLDVINGNLVSSPIYNAYSTVSGSAGFIGSFNVYSDKKSSGNGDNLGGLNGFGYNALNTSTSGFLSRASIDFRINGSSGLLQMPTDIAFSTGGTNSTVGKIERMRLFNNGNFTFGSTSFKNAKVAITGNRSYDNAGGNGVTFRIDNSTITDTSSAAGAVTSFTGTSIGAPTMAGKNAITIGQGYAVRLLGPASAGTNVTLTEAGTLYSVSGLNRFGGTIRNDALTASQLVATDATKNLVSITALPSGTTATTQSAGTNNTTVSTTAFVQAALDKGVRLTGSGTGAATTISIAHGLTGVTSASIAIVQPINAASAGISYITTDATNVNIVYTVAPASGTNNLSYNLMIKP